MERHDSAWELEVSEQGAFRFVRVDATVSEVCERCHAPWTRSIPVLCDWWDRRSAIDQASHVDGQLCPACGALFPLQYPLLQYRRGDVLGLLIGFPASSPAERDRALIRDVLAVAGPERLEGASVVVSARLKWWERVWAKPLGPVLLAGEPVVLPEGREEVERWRADTVRTLGLADAGELLGEFVTAEDYMGAAELVRSNPLLLAPRWQLTIDTLGRRLIAAQTDDEARRLVEQRLGRLRQVRAVGPDRVADTELTGELAALAGRATSTTNHDERRDALRELDSMLQEAPSNAMTAVVLNSLVSALHGDPQRAVLRDGKIESAARRAVDVARQVFGDNHLVTMSAQLNHAVVVEERSDIDRNEALGQAEDELLELAPRAARAGLPIVADIAMNLATIATQRAGSRADNPEEARELLADARHMSALWRRDDPRHTLTSLVDEASTLRASMTGPFRENALRAVELLREARRLDGELGVLSAPERVLLLGNIANAAYQLRAHAPEQCSVDTVASAAQEAVTEVNRLDRLHQIAIDTLANAGSVLADAYSDSVRASEADRSLWEAARDALEDVLDRVQEAYPPEHPTRLRVTVNAASLYGRPIEGRVADADRCENLLVTVIGSAPPDRPEFTVVAATNLGQLYVGSGRWRQAADAYETASRAQRRLIDQARTPLTKLGEVIATADLAARRALALGQLGDFEQAISVLEENRGQLVRAVAVEPANASQPKVARIHAATCDYGTVVTVRLPDGVLFGYVSSLASGQLKQALARLRQAGTLEDRQAGFDTLSSLLSTEVIDPVAAIVRASILPVEQLHVVACGPLAACPLHGIADAGGTPWTANWDLAYRVTASGPTPPEPNLDRGVALAIIDPEGDLPFAATERESVRAAFPDLAEPPAGWSARSWLLAELPQAAVVHLGCHARADSDDPMRSSIAVAKEEGVTVADLAALDTSGLELVVAPACQSAAANPHAPDEMLGVAHALIHGGAKTVVASLWDADDAATALVIARFYREVAMGSAPAAALARAQRYTRLATPQALAATARARVEGDPAESWLPYDLAEEFLAMTTHPQLRDSTLPYFAHPADWATLTVLTR